MSPAALWTIGHSAHPAEVLIGLLRRYGIARLVDVRSVPYSRRHSQFRRETLAATLRAAGIDYRHAPDLGGMREARADSPHRGIPPGGFRGYADHMDTPAFQSALDDLIRTAAVQRTCVMCAEALPEHCHRSMLADALVARQVRVAHVLTGGEARDHVLRPGAEVLGGRVRYPGPPDLFAGPGGGPSAPGRDPRNSGQVKQGPAR